MADITTSRETAQQVTSKTRRHLQIVVAAGQTLYHGTIGGFTATKQASKPGAGVFPIGRVSCPNCFVAVAGETVDLEEGSFSWDFDTGETAPAIGALVYAKSNHEVSVNAGEGQAFAIYEGDCDGKPFFLSGFGNALNVDAT